MRLNLKFSVRGTMLITSTKRWEMEVTDVLTEYVLVQPTAACGSKVGDKEGSARAERK